MKFCEVCGLYSRSSINLNRKEIYVCKCADKPKSTLKFCDKCSLYLNTSIEAYRCKCSGVFCIPDIEADFTSKSNKAKFKSKPKPKKKSKKKSKIK